MKQNTVSISNITMYYEQHGDGFPLLLTAGLGSDSQSWAPILPALAEHFLVIAPDNRGVGRTAPMNIPLDIPRMAEDIAALLDHLGLPRAHLLGHSMGGMIALECALRYPERIDRLILAAAAARPSARDIALMHNWAATLQTELNTDFWFGSIFPWLFTERFFDDPAIVEGALKYAREYPWPQSPEAFAHQVEAITLFDASSRLHTVRVPTLSIHGAEDILFPASRTLPELAAIPGLQHLILPDAAHSIHLEAPNAFAEAVLRFLSL